MLSKTAYTCAFLYLFGTNAFPTLFDREVEEDSIAERDMDLEQVCYGFT